LLFIFAAYYYQSSFIADKNREKYYGLEFVQKNEHF